MLNCAITSNAWFAKRAVSPNVSTPFTEPSNCSFSLGTADNFIAVAILIILPISLILSILEIHHSLLSLHFP